MGEDKHNNGVPKVEQLKDRLSSLSDEVLIQNILSRLSIHVAATTSVLSRRWRDLWKSVTCFYFTSIAPGKKNCLNISSGMFDIIRQLNSPKLSVFRVHMQSYSLSCSPKIVESCFRELCCRKVDQIVIKLEFQPYAFFCVPACLFQTKSLVDLMTLSSCAIMLPECATIIELPKLKRLHLHGLHAIPWWFIGTIFSSCPLLESFYVRFSKDIDSQHNIRIVAPNLKSLELHKFVVQTQTQTQTPGAKIFIDAPRLTNLGTSDSTSCYHFVHKPTRLVNVSLKMTTYDKVKMKSIVVEDYLRRMSMFFKGMSCVCKLRLSIEDDHEPYSFHTYLNHPLKNHGRHRRQQTFPNLASLRLRWNGRSLYGWENSLLLLHSFPNLSFLSLFLNEYKNSYNYWRHAPDCLAYKLKTIEITMITINWNSIDAELDLLAYILSNAMVLEKLFVSVEFVHIWKETRLWNARSFCKSLFNLPRGSSICEIVFETTNLKASSTDYKNDGWIFFKV